MAKSNEEYEVYKRRWFILCVLCLLNIVNAMIWFGFAPVANHVDEFYCTRVGCEAANWFAKSYLYSTLVVSLLALWAIEKIGLRIAVVAGSWITFLGTFLRLLSSLTYFEPHWRLPLGLTGQVISSFCQPVVRYLPSILAATWFGSNQRTLATMLASFAGIFGSLITTLAVPYLITEDRIQEGIFEFNYALACCGLFLGVASTFGVRSSHPPKPPSKSAAARITMPFIQSLKMVFTNKQFIILSLSLGCLMGSRATFMTLSQQILCVKGYSNIFVGTTMAVAIGGGAIGSLVAAIFVDRTKLFEETTKICVGISSISICAIATLINYPYLNVPIIITACIFGATGFPTLSIGLELAVECTYPVKAGLVAGIVYLAAQLWIAVLLNLLPAVTKEATPSDLKIQKCSATKSSSVLPYSWKVSNLVWAGVAVGATCVLILFFRTKYKRLMAEQGEQGDEVLTTAMLLTDGRDSHSHSSEISFVDK